MVTFGPESQLQRWEFTKIEPEEVKQTALELSIHPVLARVLITRGLTQDPQRLKEFIHPDKGLINDISNLTTPDHLKTALNRIQTAIRKKEKMIIHGDPDADGITGTTILVAGLRALGGQVSYDFPIRATEGHGLQPRIIEEAHQNGIKVLISTDCGTKDVEATAYANSLGIDVIICDHHIVGHEIPDAIAMINPQLVEGESQLKVLSGAGVSFKLIIALFGHMRRALTKPFKGYLMSLATLGTLSDRMSMVVPMNRLLIKRGAEELAITNMEGLKAIKRVCGHYSGPINAHDLTRTIVPRLNAPGRIGNPNEGIAGPNLVVDLLLLGTGKENEKRAGALLSRFVKLLDKEKKTQKDNPVEQAAIVDEVNEKRKLITSQIEDEMDRLIEEQVDPKTDRVIIIQGRNWNPGVIGIDADRLKERFLRPAIILTEFSGSDYVRGSSRSIPNINIYKYIDEIGVEFKKREGRPLYQVEVQTPLGKRTISAFGGHAQACGFTLHKRDIKAFISAIHAKLAPLKEDSFHYTYEVIDTLTIDQVKPAFVKSLQHMGPYGQRFEYPAFMIKNCTISRSIKPFGNKYQTVRLPHVQFYILRETRNHKTQKIAAVGFGLYEKFQTIVQQNPDKQFDLICTIESDLRMLNKRGQKPGLHTIRLNVQDIRMSSDVSPLVFSDDSDDL